MTSGYIEVGEVARLDPIPSLRTKLFSSPSNLTLGLSMWIRKLPLVPFLQDCRHLLPTHLRSTSS
jgi:hypothetical protein